MHLSIVRSRTFLPKFAAVCLSVYGCSGAGTSADQNKNESERTATTDESFDEFEARVYREPDTGIYILNGDEPISNTKKLREFFEFRRRPGALIVYNEGGADRVWSREDKYNLRYCVSDTFGARKQSVVDAMNSAAASWQGVADVKFIYDGAEDGNCTSSNERVVFDVNPSNSNKKYSARAFFPGDPRANRNVLIDFDYFGSSTLLGILRHELGHVLGFRHEHIRPEANPPPPCTESDGQFRPLTEYDSVSIMHYYWCNGKSSENAELTALDAKGAASLYGSPSGKTALYEPAPNALVSVPGEVAAGELKQLDPVSVDPGTSFNIALKGSGDPDLYVRFDGPPTLDRFDCRPYETGADEGCRLTVPEGRTTAYVAVRGFKAGAYEVEASYTKKP